MTLMQKETKALNYLLSPLIHKPVNERIQTPAELSRSPQNLMLSKKVSLNDSSKYGTVFTNPSS